MHFLRCKYKKNPLPVHRKADFVPIICAFSLNPFHLFYLIFLEVPFIDGDIEHDFVEGEVVLAVHRENAHVVVEARLL